MKKIKVNKGLLALLLAAGLGVGTISFALMKKQNSENDDKFENEIGYTDINPIYNLKVDEKDFVILDIGDHDSIGTHFQNRKMKMCNNNDISLGIEITSDAENEADIYDDVEYVKGIIKKYDVDFPVFLNIDKIITNTKLSIEEKEAIVNDFIRKCIDNHIIVGVSGTDTNLCRLFKYCKIDECKKFLIMDTAKIKYSNQDELDIIKDLDGNVFAANHYLSIPINDNDNNPNYFVNDFSYTMQKDDDIVDVALDAGISVQDLLEFNGLKKKDIAAGVVLRIPSKSEINNFKGLDDFEILDNPIRGCDLSLYQGTKINWDKLSANFDFAILRCSAGLETDSTFEVNAANCNLYNIPIGVYCYNMVDNTDMPDLELFVERQEMQVNHVLTLLENKNISYPVYLNLEYEHGINAHFTKTQVEKMIEIWSSRIKEAGYIPGIYCNQSDYKFLQSCLNYPISDVVQIWISGGDQYSSDGGKIEIDDVKPSEFLINKEFNAGIGQSTNICVGAGAGNLDGYLNVDFSIVDYTHIPVNNNDSEFEIKEFKRADWLLIGSGLGLVVLINSPFAISYSIDKVKGYIKKKNATK